MNSLIDTIRTSVLGDASTFQTPFGSKPLVYADYTASGRSLKFIEDFIQHKVLPFYANTHTETTYSSAQTTALREEARQEIRHAVNASSKDQVIFCGSGATGAIHKLIDILNLRLPANLCDRYPLLEQIPLQERAVVFITPYEHHSNELPWRESIAELVVIAINSDGLMDVENLEENLQRYRDRPLKIGSFSAASNVTGLKTDVDTVTRLLHRYNALSLWDYAAAGPYVSIDMSGNVTKANDNSKDAVFISPHKFIGGPSTPGILIVKQHLLNNRVPAVCGGGTVDFVSPENHRYSINAERREEGGTPAIVESIRAGLVFKLQKMIGTDEIDRLERDFVHRALTRWSKHSAIEILGNTKVPRLPIVSLRIKHNNKYLHFNFIVALLNDLFGIQARGGCSCAGPYGHRLLGIDMNYSKALEKQILNGQMLLRPGWVRLSFNYFIDANTFEYLLRAVELVAEHGWRLLPYYSVDQSTGVWRYQNIKTPMSVSLTDLDFATHCIEPKPISMPIPTNWTDYLQNYLAQAEQEICKTSRECNIYNLVLPEAAEKLRWFILPQEISSTQQYNLANKLCAIKSGC